MSVEEMKAFQEGKAARENGNAKVNPYKRYTKEEAWDAGWNSLENEGEEEPNTTYLLFGVIAVQIAGLAYILFAM